MCPTGQGGFANPPSVGRAPFEGWHPYNGVRLNKPRLGFVLCRGFADGEPYAEGYFLEYDHDLSKEERFRFDPSETMPPFDPATAPKLDPEVWPPDRIAKSKRNFGRGYVEVSISSLVEVLDAPTVVGIVGKSYRGIAIQYGRRLLEELGIKGSDAGALATFMKHLTDMAGDEAELTSPLAGQAHSADNSQASLRGRQGIRGDPPGDVRIRGDDGQDRGSGDTSISDGA